MENRRSEVVILTEILRASLEKPGITRIMYTVNLNHRAADKFLNDLQKKGLIVTVGQPLQRKFQTTSKGKEVLDRLEDALQLLR